MAQPGSFASRGRRALTLVPVVLLVVLSLAHTALSLDCYTSVDLRVREDCQMHTGCVKKFNPRTQQTLFRGCFLSNGVNDTCGRDSDGVGVCYCHSDLCNGATTALPALPALAVSVAAAVGAAAARARLRGLG